MSNLEEMLIWTSYRYCIGRKTYVSSLASYIGKTYYDKLSDDKLRIMAIDIRKNIADVLRFNTPSFHYDCYINTDNALNDYLQWLTDNISDTKELYGIKEIVCSLHAGKKVFYTSKTEQPLLTPYEHNYSDLLEWEKLASLFDKGNHKKVKVSYDGKEEILTCFEYWDKEIKPDKNNYYVSVPWKYKKYYKSVDRYLEGKTGYVNPDYIIEVC